MVIGNIDERFTFNFTVTKGKKLKVFRLKPKISEITNPIVFYF